MTSPSLWSEEVGWAATCQYPHYNNSGQLYWSNDDAEFTKALTGFDESKFATCLIERKTAPQIDAAIAFAQQNGINATPTAFVNGQKMQIVAPEQIRTLIRQYTEQKTTAAADAPRQER